MYLQFFSNRSRMFPVHNGVLKKINICSFVTLLREYRDKLGLNTRMPSSFQDFPSQHHDGYTPLELACVLGLHGHARCLLEHGATPNSCDGHARTCLDLLTIPFANDGKSMVILANTQHLLTRHGSAIALLIKYGAKVTRRQLEYYSSYTHRPSSKLFFTLVCTPSASIDFGVSFTQRRQVPKIKCVRTIVKMSWRRLTDEIPLHSRIVMSTIVPYWMSWCWY